MQGARPPSAGFGRASQIPAEAAALLFHADLLLIRDRRCCPVQFGEAHREFLVIRLRLVLQDADCGCFSQHHRDIAVAAPMDAGMDSMAECDVVGEFVQFAVHSDLAAVGTRVGHEREAIIARHKRNMARLRVACPPAKRVRAAELRHVAARTATRSRF